MNRCFSAPLRYAIRCLAFLGLTLVLFAPAAYAQTMGPDGLRVFPADVQRGILFIDMPPHVKLDGQDEILAPGAHIYGLNHTLVLSGTVSGQNLVVNYRRDLNGQLSEIWLLTPAEASAPVLINPGQQKASAQTAKPYRVQDALTPYDQLPSYEEAAQNSQVAPASE